MGKNSDIESELRTFFYVVAVPDQEFKIGLFEDWVFETTDIASWETAIHSSDYQTLNELISNFEDAVVDNFLKAASDNTIYVDERITDDEETDRIYFREIICSMYMYIYGDYINTVYKDFDFISKRVYREMYDEPDEIDEGCNDPIN